MQENPKKENNEPPTEGFPSCECCAWRKEKFSGVIPCEYCIRNPKLMSTRWTAPKELKIQEVSMKVPRDMYISEEMLEFFKALLNASTVENEMLKRTIEILQGRNSSQQPIPNVPPNIGYYPNPWVNWKYTDNSGETTVSWNCSVITSGRKKYVARS